VRTNAALGSYLRVSEAKDSICFQSEPLGLRVVVPRGLGRTLTCFSRSAMQRLLITAKADISEDFIEVAFGVTALAFRSWSA